MSSVAKNVRVIAAGPDDVLMHLGVILNPVKRGGTLSAADKQVSWKRDMAQIMTDEPRVKTPMRKRYFTSFSPK